MNLQEHIQLWNQATLKVLDIRHRIIPPGQGLLAYQLPSSVFLYGLRGKARIRLDGVEYSAVQGYLCHAGKGAYLEISEITESFEYYLIFYRAVLTKPCRQELLVMLERSKPFQVQYGFTPQHPALLYPKLDQMQREWSKPGAIDKLRTKTMFYQFLCELLEQLAAQQVATGLPDLSVQAIRYMEEHYAEPITLEAIADRLLCSPRQLQRQFKSKLRSGPIDYLLQLRMDKARELLLHTAAPIKAVSEAVGYTDSYHFSRMFKRIVGIPPTTYRLQAAGADIVHGRQNPAGLSSYAIAAKGGARYIGVSDDENDYHLQRYNGGTTSMFRNSRAGWAVSLLLSLTLILAACSGTPAGSGPSGNGSSENRNTVVVQTASPANTAEAAKSSPQTIKHMKSELLLKQTPAKIVVLDTQFIDQMVTLGGQPTGSVIVTSDTAEFPDFLADQLQGVTVLGTKEEPNLEAIVGLSPDLIICTEFSEEIYEELQKIAPTLMFERNEDWRITLQSFGQIMGKQQEAKQVLDEYTDKVNTLSLALKEKLGNSTVAMIRPRDGQVRLHTTAHRTAAILYQDLGLNPPPMAVDDTETSQTLSLEILPELNVDHLFVLTDDKTMKLTGEFQETSIWQNLEAVKSEQVHTVNTTLWIAYYGPVAMSLIVDQISEALL
ncbi:Fe3+-hydroxamate ABC transporter substrate-binding protein [Paenibacillus donghaensis]|uniref:Fe3+-hydroxamate ABC transporter substrate-binding protein n=2 Tax=Paenibacillus donghaensis TaxID=414771 RepID=A0A2Z2KQX8_9BACL|nr:Fe3+-hydroxamate ABC transporter substrate-binding protein [Paenibacillus donghaensis]